VGKLAAILKGELLLFPAAAYGSLHDYIMVNGCFS
jgi:hypothetical protein